MDATLCGVVLNAQSNFWDDVLAGMLPDGNIVVADCDIALARAQVVLALLAMLGNLQLCDCVRASALLHAAYPRYVQAVFAAGNPGRRRVCCSSSGAKRPRHCGPDVPFAADPAAVAAEVRQLCVAAASDCAISSGGSASLQSVDAVVSGITEDLSLAACRAAGISAAGQAALWAASIDQVPSAPLPCVHVDPQVMHALQLTGDWVRQLLLRGGDVEANPCPVATSVPAVVCTWPGASASASAAGPSVFDDMIDCDLAGGLSAAGVQQQDCLMGTNCSPDLSLDELLEGLDEIDLDLSGFDLPEWSVVGSQASIGGSAPDHGVIANNILQRVQPQQLPVVPSLAAGSNAGCAGGGAVPVVAPPGGFLDAGLAAGRALACGGHIGAQQSWAITAPAAATNGGLHTEHRYSSCSRCPCLM